MKKMFFVAVCFALLCTTPLFAGPRWWWNDVPVAQTPADSTFPDVTMPIGTTTPVRAIFVVWQEQLTAGDPTTTEIFLSASFDDGCSFCDPVRITNNTLEDRYPRVAAAVGAGTQLRVQVAHEEVDTTTHILVTYNVNLFDIATLSCASLTGTNWTKKQLDQMGTPHISGRPDIAATVFNPTNPSGTAQFAVAWQEQYPLSNGHDDILVAFDPQGNGSYGAPTNITNSTGPYDQRPAIIMSNGVPGVPPTNLIGVAYVTGAGDMGTAKQVMFDYSTNNGTSFTGATPLNITPAWTAPALDAGVQPFGLMDTKPDWFGASWLTPGSSGNPQGLFFNAELLDISRGGVVSPWVLPPSNLLPANPKSGVGFLPPAVAVLPAPASGTAIAFWDFWSDLNNPAQSEIYYRAGVLDESATPQINPNLFPINPPGGVSANTQLTGIAPPRPANSHPDAPAADAQSTYPPCNADTAFVVFQDNRSGNYDIFFKRLDTCLTDSSFTVTAPLCLPQDGSLDAHWPQKQCPTATERLASIKVYYATVSGGPYTLGASPAVDSTIGTVTGLQQNTDYYFIVLFEDEAGNTAPTPFDPTINNVPTPRGETLVHTPAYCQAKLDVTKTWVDNDGAPLLPRDTVRGTITVHNPISSGTPASAIVVEDTVDTANLQNVATADPDGVVAVPLITWTTGQTLQPDESLVRSFTGTVKCDVGSPAAPIADGTQIPNATFNAQSTETGRVNGQAPVALTVNRPVLSITKTMDTVTPVQGSLVYYTVTVCNTGSAPETGVVIRDTLPTTPFCLDATPTENPDLGGGTYFPGPPSYIEWTLPTVNPGLPCQTIHYGIELEETCFDQRVCNFAQILSTTGVYRSCSWAMPAAVQACFQSPPQQNQNHLLKNCPWVSPLPPLKVINDPPDQTTDTGLTAAPTLCFYQVETTIVSNSVKIVKSTVADTIDIYYQ